MKKLLALALAAAVSLTSALALTTQELGTILEKEYAGSVPRQVWEQTTVEGMLEALGDPFTHYYDAATYAAFVERANGSTGETPNRFSAENGVGWVELNHFGGNIQDMERLAGQGLTHWVVDLRGNRGGELRAAVEDMGVFAGTGELVFLQDRDGKLYSAKSQQSKLTIHPAIVLIGENTASAGELYAAAIRDRQRGLLIGSRTYGKGVAQSAFDQTSEAYGSYFADGSALLLTTERVFSENMASNNIIGVLPHLMVEGAVATDVARLLCADAPGGNTAGYLRLHLGWWRWYVDLNTADQTALRTLLEAIPPQAELYEGTGGADGWRQTTAQEVASTHRVAGYTPRVFSDAAGSPYADAINALKTYGIVKGDESGRFNPTDGLTRASLCALLAQAMDYPMSKADPAFADTPAGAWYTPYVTTLSALGIVNGYDDGLFHPDDPIPHQQFMTILARVVANTNCSSAAALSVGPKQETLDSGDYAAYDSWAVPGAWLLDGAWHAAARDIDPRSVTTREEAAYDLWSALSTMGLLP